MAAKRTTSAAKDVEMESYTPGPLEERQGLGDEFHARSIRDYYEPNYENDNNSDTERGSSTLRSHAPRPEQEHRPSGDMAEAVDRETFDARQAAENERARELAAYEEQILAQYEAEIASQNQHERGNDYDDDYGM